MKTKLMLLFAVVCFVSGCVPLTRYFSDVKIEALKKEISLVKTCEESVNPYWEFSRPRYYYYVGGGRDREYHVANSDLGKLAKKVHVDFCMEELNQAEKIVDIVRVWQLTIDRGVEEMALEKWLNLTNVAVEVRIVRKAESIRSEQKQKKIYEILKKCVYEKNDFSADFCPSDTPNLQSNVKDTSGENQPKIQKKDDTVGKTMLGVIGGGLILKGLGVLD